MLINNFDKLTVREKPLVKTVLPKIDLKQVSKPQKLPIDIENFVSPYGRKKLSNEVKINGIRTKHIDTEKLLNDSRDSNSTLPGWSAQEIAQHRNEIQQYFKPETLEAFKALKHKRLKRETIDTKLLTQINDIVKETQDDEKISKETEIKGNQNLDLSFLPINPNNNYVHMNNLEMDKLEWMKYIDEKADKAKIKSIRFHITGICFPPDDEDEKLFDKPPIEFDPFIDSLNHHGDEPTRKGYTISELFWLARSSFSMQRSLAVLTLINMLKKSANLEHVYHFNLPTITQSLVDCGIVFLARWLIDESGEREQYLCQALELLHTILSNTNPSDTDGIQFNWPQSSISLYRPQLIDESVHMKQKARLELSLSEQTKLQDDILMTEDIVSCLVSRTKFLERISFLFVTKKLVRSFDEKTVNYLLEIIERIVQHSMEMACVIANDHEDLLMALIDCHLSSKLTNCTSNLIRVIRRLCQSSHSIGHKLTRDQKIIQSIYPLITNSEFINVKIESLRLLTVFIHCGIHIGPIITIIPLIIEQLICNLTNSEWISSVTHSLITCLSVFMSSNSVISHDLYLSIESTVLSIQSKFLLSLHHPPFHHHPILASMLHLINKFTAHQYSRQDLSCHSVAINFWNQIISLLLSSDLLDCLLVKLLNLSVLGYEHWNSNHELICLDLINLLHDSIRLAVKTRNPKFIDIQPFFIELDPSFSLLSAICHSISLMASTRISLSDNFSIALNFISNPHLIKFLNFVAESNLDKVGNVSPHSSIVQLQLEATSQLIISIVDVSLWTNVPINNQMPIILYKAAIKILPHLGPCLYSVGINLLNKVIFNPILISSIQLKIDPSIMELLLEFLPNVRNLYENLFPNFQNPTNLPEPINNTFVPVNWIDYPFIKKCKRKSSENSDKTIDLVLSPDSIAASLAFISFLETGNIIHNKIIPIIGIRRLYHILITNDWMDNLWHPTTRLILTNFLNQYLSNISQIDISSKHLNPTSFFGLFNALSEQYFSVSLCDSLLVNLILFPCAMRFPIKYRKTFWKINFDSIRLIIVDLSESIIPIGEYLQPEEIDNEMIRHYWHVLKMELISETRNELLYWICIHHLNRFVFNQSLGSQVTASQSCDDFVFSVQRGVVHAITNPQWQHKSWIKHVKFYKLFANSTAEFYDELPVHRIQHLNKLQQLADNILTEKS